MKKHDFENRAHDLEAAADFSGDTLSHGAFSAGAFTDRNLATETEMPSSETPEVDLRALRRRLGMTRKEFAKRFRINFRTLENWEQGKRKPEDGTRLYLLMIEKDAQAVENALFSIFGGAGDFTSRSKQACDAGAF